MTIQNKKNLNSKPLIESKKLSLYNKLNRNEINISSNDITKGSKMLISKRK